MSEKEHYYADEKAETKVDVLTASSVGSVAGDPSLLSYTHKEERGLIGKMDFALLSFAMGIYITAFIDRGSLGNARLMGITKDVLSNNDKHFSFALSCFFITYIVFSIPGTLFSKIVPPSTSLGLGCFLWSAGAAGIAATHNPAGVFVCRMFIGLGEATFGLGVALLFSFWYTKEELQKRFGVLIAGAGLAGAFGGLIAFGVNSIKHSKITQWRILFMIEGFPGISRYFTKRQREIAIARMAKDSIHEGDNGLDMRGLKRAVLDWKSWVMCVIFGCYCANTASVNGFFPTLIRSLGYQGARAQLFTVPPYAVGLVVTFIVTVTSDRIQRRGYLIAPTFMLGCLGWALMLGLDAASTSRSILHARYFGCICLVSAAYATVPMIVGWVTANTPSHSQRAMGLGMLNTVGQCAAVGMSYAFPIKDTPHYRLGLGLNVGFTILGAVLALAMTAYYKYENARRDREEGEVDQSKLNVQEDFDLAKGFRYAL